MKNIVKQILLNTALGLSLITAVGCERDVNELGQAEFSQDPNVFIDDFSSGLNYAAFGGSAPKAFQVDTQVKYAGTKSMRFEVPDVGSPEGAYAGGSYFTTVGRDLSGYNALSFYIKASQAANIDVIGFGNDLGENKYQVSINALPVNTNWKKVYIPIPDPAKLKSEKGMFFYSEGAENGRGYTFWIDEVKFEKVPGIAAGSAGIMNGTDKTINSFIGVKQKVDGLINTFNLPNGTNQAVNITPQYFNFTSSNTSVATVDEMGNVDIVGTGTAVIKATVGETTAAGSLTINSAGTFVAAPTPTQSASRVISVFSDSYTNVPVDYYNGYWAPYQTTTSADFSVNGNNILNYGAFNFVGIQTSSPTINASAMTHFHMDIFLPNAMTPGASFRMILVDFGNDGAFGGGDDTRHTTSITAPLLQGQKWVSINLPFSAMPGLSGRAHIGQIILEGTSIPSFYADNIYFYN